MCKESTGSLGHLLHLLLLGISELAWHPPLPADFLLHTGAL